jgi:hypothetical protein
VVEQASPENPLPTFADPVEFARSVLGFLVIALGIDVACLAANVPSRLPTLQLAG